MANNTISQTLKAPSLVANTRYTGASSGIQYVSNAGGTADIQFVDIPGALQAGWTYASATSETVGSKLRRFALQAQQNGNPMTNTPWQTEAAWVTATAYQQNHIVSNAGNLYNCLATIATSGTAPTGTGTTPITDGSGSWTYIGPVINSSAQAGAPVVTVTSNTAFGFGVETTLYNKNWGVSYPVSGQLATFTGGLWFNYAAANLGVSFYGVSGPTAGATQTQPNNGAGWPIQPNFQTGYSLPAITQKLVFYTDSVKFGVGISSGGGNGSMRILVDDKYVTYGNYVAANVPGNAIVRATVDFTATYPTRQPKLRKVVIEIQGYTSFFYSLNFNQQDSVFPLARNQFIRAVWFTDSFGGPTGLGGDFTNMVGKYLGWEDNWSWGQAGAGVIAPNTINAGTVPYIYRYQDVATCPDPDVIVIQGSVNDGSWGAGNGYTSVQTTTLALLQNIRQLRGNVPIFFIGVNNSPSNQSRYPLTDAAYQAAIAQFNDPQTFYFSITNDTTGPWVTGTGYALAQTGVGNNDIYNYDATHYVSPVGYRYYSQRIADKIRQAIQLIP